MLMNRWRVGSLSMGLVLVALGILMSVSLIAKVNVLNIIITLWPVILVSLGIEILLHIFIKKDENTKIRYDILGILFIGVILILSVFFYFITFSIEFFGSREDMYNAFGINIRNEEIHSEFNAGLAGTDELVIFSGVNSVRVLAAQGSEIRVDYTISADTNDKEYAESIVSSLVKLETGKKAYLMSDASLFYGNRKMGYPSVNCTVYLPEGKRLDLTQHYGRVEYDSAVEEQIIQH